MASIVEKAEREETIAPAPASAPGHFSAAEQESFHHEDRSIAASIACIMGVIFVVALIAYTYIAFVAWSQPWP